MGAALACGARRVAADHDSSARAPETTARGNGALVPEPDAQRDEPRLDAPATPPPSTRGLGLEQRERQRLEHTPLLPAERSVFKFFCPLCMMHYRVVWQATCCQHQLCFDCALGYLKRRPGLADLTEIPTSRIPAECPHCRTSGFVLALLDGDAP